MAGKASKKFDLGELTRALSDAPEAVPNPGALCLIPLDDLLPNPKNPYPLLWEGDMEKLMDSIEDAGLLEPVSAYPMDGGKYMLVSGHNRREAYRRLRAERDDGTHRWDKMPCVIAEAPDSAAKERIILVEANRQRVKTPKILTMEMETIGDAYYELVQAGQKPPGRKRDWIAKQMDITSARVGRLAKISKGLAPCYKPLWDAGDLPEDTADALAGLPQEVQERIKRVCPKKTPTANAIRAMGERMESRQRDYFTVGFRCPDGGVCTHQDKFFRHDLTCGSWECCGGAKCCVECSKGGAHSPDGGMYGAACAEMCAKARAVYEKAKAEKKDSEKREATEARSKAAQKAMADAARIVRAADAAGLDDDTTLESTYPSLSKIGTLRKIAQGDIPEAMSNYVLGEIIPYRTDNLTSMAQALHCSTDYLLGLTDQLRSAAAEPGRMVLAAWMPGGLTPPEPCEVVADVDAGEGVKMRRLLYWDGAVFRFKKSGVDIEVSVIRWLRLPETEKEENDD